MNETLLGLGLPGGDWGVAGGLVGDIEGVAQPPSRVARGERAGVQHGTRPGARGSLSVPLENELSVISAYGFWTLPATVIGERMGIAAIPEQARMRDTVIAVIVWFGHFRSLGGIAQR